ncbi:GRIP-related arf-binding domain-containing protein [Trichoderma breve]|uniref:GRIP-related arf-binding domain-containing protein n=1 Tax=Trichoderma breve TaxID=2034170 RepID=A0A9W9BCE5_9HYPO|nr:GRIP-related arf-binding domain-containing protein [Trichoderma breve]KAJ4859889.1 GRIP-related arf-binding domain-containing protein [Trichoderma breve]
MSSTAATEPSLASNSAAKKKNNKKKKNANKSKEPAQTSNGDARIDKDELDDEPDTPTTAEIPSTSNVDNTEEPKSETNGHPVAPSNHDLPEPHAPAQQPDGESDTSAKLEAMSKEREALRAELEDSNAARETAEEQYQTLLGRVEKIKETLSDRLKRDKAELEEAKEHIEELEAQNEELRNAAESSSESLAKVREELQDATRELTTLRSRNNLSANNWGKEREELIRSIQHLKEEMETTSNAMGEWEVIAMEERSIKENLGDKVAELEEEVVGLREGYEAAAAERDSQATLIDNLQNALREIQDARKKELRDLVETSEAQLQEQKKLVQEAVAKATEAQEAKAELVKELERTVPFEKEVKEKNLLIGKLRHEAIVLNDHLTKALRYLKKTKPEDNVDRQVVTNHLLHFLTLDRGDAKRFQVLQVMAGYLNWTDEQREQAGLRTPSSPSLSADIFSEPSSARDRESLAELWAGFLERSAQEGTSDGPSRKGSTSSVATAGVTIGRPESRS